MNPIVRLVLTFGLMWSLGGGPASAAVVVKLGHDQPEKSPHHEGALKWRELVESRTKGQVQVKIFASQLGSCPCHHATKARPDGESLSVTSSKASISASFFSIRARLSRKLAIILVNSGIRALASWIVKTLSCIMFCIKA